MFKSIKQITSELLEPARRGQAVDNNSSGRTIYHSVSPVDQEVLGIEGATKRFADAAKKVTAKTHDMIAAMQGDMLDGVDGMMNIGDGIMKPTMSLTKEEAERVINVRDKQLINDTNKLRKLRQLYIRALPAWDNPEARWGDCLKAVAEAAHVGKRAA